MDTALDRGVLRRQAERVPAEGMQHVVAAHPLGARHHVADDVVPHVADVSVAGRIREHLEAVELRARRIDGHLEGARVSPAFLPLLVEFLRMVVGHGCSMRQLPTSNVPTSNRSLGIGIGSWELTWFNYSFQYFARCGVTALIVASPRGVGPSGVRRSASHRQAHRSTRAGSWPTRPGRSHLR